MGDFKKNALSVFDRTSRSEKKSVEKKEKLNHINKLNLVVQHTTPQDIAFCLQILLE